MKCIARLVTFLLVLTVPAYRAAAVEGGLGRPVSGMQINPYAGLVPPMPGLTLSAGELYYTGSIEGSRALPIGGLSAVGVEADVSFTPVSAIYIWNTGTNLWNFASALNLSFVWTEAGADVSVNGITRHQKDSATGLFDMMFVPLVASRHFSQTDHLSLSTVIWAPTGEYDPGHLANVSLNNWTFIPTVAYTKILPASGIEISASWAMEFYTENPDTDYQNGIVSDLELLAVKRFKNGLGLGIVGSWIEQITYDDSPLADALDGFRGTPGALDRSRHGQPRLGTIDWICSPAGSTNSRRVAVSKATDSNSRSRWRFEEARPAAPWRQGTSSAASSMIPVPNEPAAESSEGGRSIA